MFAGNFALIFLAIAVTIMVILVIGRDPAVETSAAENAIATEESPTATPTVLTPPRDRVEGIESVLVIGDGTARIEGLEPGWPKLLATKRDWRLTNLARYDSGYNLGFSGADCPIEACPSFLDSIVPALESDASPDLIIVSGGGWDGLQDVSTRRVAVAAFFSALRANFRSAGIIALSPMWLDEPLPAPLGPVKRAVREQVTRIGGAYLDVGSPFQHLPDGADPLAFNDQANVAVREALDTYLDELSAGAP